VVVTFDLERFEWAAPDRLQLAGTFSGLDEGAAAAPTLVLHGAERTHRLPAVEGDGSDAPMDGEPWAATFAWQDVPEAFDAAELELGPDVTVQLPEPHAGQRSFGGQRLPVRKAAEREPEAARQNGSPPPAAEEGRQNSSPPPAAEEGRQNGSPPPAAERLRLQSELVSAQEEARELRAELERAEEELSRARQDLQAERERHAADSERFREGLASVQASAEEALAAEQLGADELRAELDAALDARREAEAAMEPLREQLAALEKTEEDNERLRAELELARVQAEAARARREGAYGAAAEARDQVQQLLERIVAVRDALDDDA
jgi:hypothetical protein